MTKEVKELIEHCCENGSTSELAQSIVENIPVEDYRIFVSTSYCKTDANLFIANLRNHGYTVFILDEPFAALSKLCRNVKPGTNGIFIDDEHKMITAIIEKKEI